MFTVALIGPDGSGKTTVCEQLQQSLPLPWKYLYMGINRDSSNRMLPTTYLVRQIRRACGAKPDKTGPRDSNKSDSPSGNIIRRSLKTTKSLLSLANRMCDEWYRQSLCWFYQKTEHIVLFDRHYFCDYYAYDIANTATSRSLSRRIHGFMLDRVYPKPDLIIYLDAPAEVLFARKGEGTLETLEQRRQEYLQMSEMVDHFTVVDVNRPLDDVVRDVSELIEQFHRTGTIEPNSGIRSKIPA